MKVIPEHFNQIKSAIIKASESHLNHSLFCYKANSQTVTRWGWDMLWLAQHKGYIDRNYINNTLYRVYNDNHIDTAIRRIANEISACTMENKTQSPDYAALWCFIGSRLEISDNEAQGMALRLMAKGIKTWEQWVNAGQVVA